MKKILGIILLVALALVTFGCKPEADLGADARNWNNLQSIGGNSQNLLQIKASEFDIDWWVITDEKGIVIEDYNAYIVEPKAEANNPVQQSSPIPQGTTIELKFNFEKNTKVVLWIAQDERVPKNTKADGTQYEAGSKDYRGRIPVGPNQGYIAEDKGYREEMSPVAILELTCNETAKNNPNPGNLIPSTNWNGNYRITEIWPLSQVKEDGEATPQWAATEGLKFKLEEGNYIEEGETMKVIFPAETEVVLAIKQPDRLTEEERAATPKHKGDEAWYEDIKDYTTNGELHDNLWWCIKAAFPKHETLEFSSSECNARFVLSANHLYDKSALGATYIIDDADIVYAASEK